jgi:hypothetical protein
MKQREYFVIFINMTSQTYMSEWHISFFFAGRMARKLTGQTTRAKLIYRGRAVYIWSIRLSYAARRKEIIKSRGSNLLSARLEPHLGSPQPLEAIGALMGTAYRQLYSYAYAYSKRLLGPLEYIRISMIHIMRVHVWLFGNGR